MARRRKGTRPGGGRRRAVLGLVKAEAAEAALGALKAAEDARPEAATLLLADLDARKVAAAWTTFPVAWAPDPKAAIPDDPIDRWTWAWAGARWRPGDAPIVETAGFPDALAEAAGLPAFIIAEKWRMLRAARLVYPDGGLQAYAAKLLRAAVLEAVGDDESSGDGEGD